MAPAFIITARAGVVGTADTAIGEQKLFHPVCPSPRSRRTFFFSGTIDLSMQKTVRTLAEFEIEAAHFASTLTPHGERAMLVTLSGELGAGKTAFTKAVAHALGAEEEITSPTFVLEKIYGLTGSVFKRLVHIDAYRLEKGGDLSPLKFDELLRDPSNLIVLEWPENVADTLPELAAKISITARDDGARTISYA